MSLLSLCAWCQLCWRQVVVHQDTRDAWLHAHCPLCGAEALDIGSVVDLWDHMAKCLDDLLSDAANIVIVWISLLCCYEDFQSSSEDLISPLDYAESGVRLSWRDFQLDAMIVCPGSCDVRAPSSVVVNL